MVRRNSVGKYRRNSDDFAVNRNVVGNSSEYTDELPTTTTYSVTNVRRPWCPSEPPSKFGVFSCSEVVTCISTSLSSIATLSSSRSQIPNLILTTVVYDASTEASHYPDVSVILSAIT
ncbi:hypothetical protein DY000_02041065 [Brassica cretica]|uniref:Uncharacterized protein n=1 Tax=Brassica cretica TaxID=69181 RepID=A0ABQ7BKS3_BRACR|nr:hypothetical protein DY000_02041065 [Brassica cretica]